MKTGPSCAKNMAAGTKLKYLLLEIHHASARILSVK